MNKTQAFGIFFLLLSSTAQAISVNQAIQELKIGMPMESVAKTLGQPSQKESDHWTYLAAPNSKDPSLELGWKEGKLDFAIIRLSTLEKPNLLIPSNTQGIPDLKEKHRDLVTGNRAFLIPTKGLRIEMQADNQLQEVSITAPWPTQQKTIAFSSFLNTKNSDIKVKKNGGQK